jgi:hypothetical protein
VLLKLLGVIRSYLSSAVSWALLSLCALDALGTLLLHAAERRFGQSVTVKIVRRRGHVKVYLMDGHRRLLLKQPHPKWVARDPKGVE